MQIMFSLSFNWTSLAAFISWHIRRKLRRLLPHLAVGRWIHVLVRVLGSIVLHMYCLKINHGRPKRLWRRHCLAAPPWTDSAGGTIRQCEWHSPNPAQPGFPTASTPDASAAHIGAVLNEESKLEVPCLPDADAWRCPDRRSCRLLRNSNRQRACEQVRAIELHSDRHRHCEFAWTAGDIDPLPGTSRDLHRRTATSRLDGAHKNATGHSVRLRHNVEAPVQSIDPVDIRMARQPEDRPRATRLAHAAMCGRIAFAQVSLHLNYRSGKWPLVRAVKKGRAKEVSGECLG